MTWDGNELINQIYQPRSIISKEEINIPNLKEIEMSKEKRVFQVPSVEEMDVAESQQRKEIPKSHFGRRSAGSGSEGSSGQSPPVQVARSSTGEEKPKEVREQQPWPVAAQSTTTAPAAAGRATASAFQECFSKLTESEQYSEIQKDLKNLKSAEIPVQVPVRKQPPGSGNYIMVNPRQRGNPLLKAIQNVPYEFADVIPDYVMGRTTCALFLSLRYHNLNPEYIHGRLKQLGQLFDLRVLLVLVDTKDPHHTLKELTKISIMANCTMLLAWSSDEAGRFIETYKIFEHKPPDILMKKQDADPGSKLIDALTSVKSINRNDAVMLLTTFGTLENVLKATKEELSLCAGMGQLKAGRLHAVLHDSFAKASKKTK